LARRRGPAKCPSSYGGFRLLDNLIIKARVDLINNIFGLCPLPAVEIGTYPLYQCLSGAERALVSGVRGSPIRFHPVHGFVSGIAGLGLPLHSLVSWAQGLIYFLRDIY
jgi:hypothetical protein